MALNHSHLNCDRGAMNDNLSTSKLLRLDPCRLFYYSIYLWVFISLRVDFVSFSSFWYCVGVFCILGKWLNWLIHRFLAHLSRRLKWAFLIKICPLIVRRRCRRCRCRKLFIFSSSSPKPLGQFQPNLAQSILGWRGPKFVQMKGPVLFQGKIIMK